MITQITNNQVEESEVFFNWDFFYSHDIIFRSDKNNYRLTKEQQKVANKKHQKRKKLLLTNQNNS